MFSRREFLESSTKAIALAGGVAMGLESLVGCTLKETREDITNQRWDINPIILIPKEGCYIGGHHSEGSMGLWINAALNAKDYGLVIGKVPAFWDFSIGWDSGYNDRFPKEECDYLINEGIIPQVKYQIYPFANGKVKIFKTTAKGNYDEYIKRFIKQVLDFGKPVMFVPFKEANSKGGYWPYAGESSRWFKEAWRHMHDIFEREGANTNTIWALNYLGTCFRSARNLESFYPGDDVVDWIGFTVVNRVMVRQYPWTHFRYLFSADYKWARHNHPTKPLALFEMVQSNNRNQPKWIRKAYGDVKKRFPAIKMVQWWEARFRVEGWGIDDQHFSSNTESIEAMQEVHKDPYFIGAPLAFLEKYRRD